MPAIARQVATDAGQSVAVPTAWFEGRFAEWLRDRMAERGVTQRMVALRSGLSHSTISRLLDDDRQPSLMTALTLLSVLGAGSVPLRRIVQEDAS